MRVTLLIVALLALFMVATPAFAQTIYQSSAAAEAACLQNNATGGWPPGTPIANSDCELFPPAAGYRRWCSVRTQHPGVCQVAFRFIISCDLGHTGPPPTSGNVTGSLAEAYFQCAAFNSGTFVDRHNATTSTVYTFKECRESPAPSTYVQAIYDVATHTVEGESCVPGHSTEHHRAQYSWAPDDSCANLVQTLPPTWEQSTYCNAGCEYQVVGSCGHGSVGCMLAAESTGAGCGSNYEPPPPPTDPDDPDPEPDPDPPGGDPDVDGTGATNEHLGPKLDAIAEAVRRHHQADERGHAETQAAIAAVVNDQTTKLGQKIDGTTNAVGQLGPRIDGVSAAVNAQGQAIVDAIEGIEGSGGTEVSGGGECGSPPTCDATVGECIMVVNLYRLRCGSESDLGDLAGTISVVDSAIEHFTGFNPGDWEIPGDGDDGELEGIDAIRYTQTIGPDLIDDSRFMGGGSCPVFQDIQVRAASVGIDLSDICKLLEWMSYFVLALAWFQAARIISS